MTSKSARKVVIINDINSKLIEQAIFILKSDDGKEPSGMEIKRNDEFIVKEARGIIENYIKQVDRTRGYVKEMEQKTKQKKKQKISRENAVRAAISIAAIIATAGGILLCVHLANMLI